MSTSDTDQFRDILDHWEELREQGQEPSVEELCREAPHLADRLREWTRVLKTSDWMCRRADEVADETFGEAGVLTAEEKDRHRTLGEYDLLEELGGGGMGRVFKAVHRKMNRVVALKLLPDSLVQSPESVERFRREVQALARLSHPNVVAVHDAGVADGAHYYVMDLIDGRDLARVVKEDGPLSTQQAVDYLVQAARGLEYAHSVGIVHRDIKPSNLVLDRDGTVKILDLGIARFQPLPEQASDDLTRTGCVLGTVDYMAPEQALNTKRADHHADIYSLGCTLYFLLTGLPLYDGDTVMERLVAHREHPVPSLRKACPAVPEWLDAIFRKTVAKKPEDRYQSVHEVIAALETPPSSPIRHGKHRHRVMVVAATAAMVVGVAVFFNSKTLQKFLTPNVAHPVVRVTTKVNPPAPTPPNSPPGNPPHIRKEDLLKKDKIAMPPIKPTWRTTGEYPLIAGTWWEWKEKDLKVTITQHGNEFVATTTYKEGDQKVSWRTEGRITKNGHITARLVHTQPHSPDQWKPQKRRAILEPDGKKIVGYAAWNDGGSEFKWTLIEPRAADTKEVSR